MFLNQQSGLRLQRPLGAKMRYTIFVRKFVMLALSCYFLFVIYRASKKLSSENIGTIFRTIRGKAVQARHSL